MAEYAPDPEYAPVTPGSALVALKMLGKKVQPPASPAPAWVKDQPA